MSKQTIVTGAVEEVRHIGHSAKGTPRFAVILTDGRLYRTKPDAMLNYEIANYRPTFSYATGEYVRLFCKVELVINGNQHIEEVHGDDSFETRQKFEGFEPEEATA